MTPEKEACQTLLGEKLGSIRNVLYSPHRDAALATPGALELETKSGRFVHIAPTADGGCLIAGGPVPAPSEPALSFVRHWTDLTAEVPGAFDDRPVVTAMEPVRRGDKTCGCAIEFSSGARLVYEPAVAEPRLVAG